MECWNNGMMDRCANNSRQKGSNDWKFIFSFFCFSMIPTRHKAGLTLIEVMLAIVILGIGAGVLLVATSRCMAVATKARHYSTAHRLIQRVNVEKPLTRGELEDGTESGTFENGYSWEREVLQSENEDREGLYTVRTRVSWSARGRDAFEEFTTYLYVPPEKEIGAPTRRSRPSASNPSRRRSTPSAGGAPKSRSTPSKGRSNPTAGGGSGGPTP